jgi:hypothetical protein
MKCLCRNCGKKYDSLKARGDWKGYCSAKCQHDKAKAYGYRKGSSRSEYDILHSTGLIGDVPTEEEKEHLRKELKSLKASLYSNPTRIRNLITLIRALV